MASWFANFLVGCTNNNNPLNSKPVPLLFRPVATVSSRRFCSIKTNIIPQKKANNLFLERQKENNLKLEGICEEDSFFRVKKNYWGAFDPQLPAIKNLARLLSRLDEEYHYPVSSRSLRWNVMEDAKALYLVRDMYDCTGTKPVEEYTDFDSFCGPSRVFGCVRVYEWMDMIRIIVGRDGPTPGVMYGGFLIDIDLPEDIFIHDGQKRPINVKNGALKITIFKHENKWIHTITTRANLLERVRQVSLYGGRISFRHVFKYFGQLSNILLCHCDDISYQMKTDSTYPVDDNHRHASQHHHH